MNKGKKIRQDHNPPNPWDKVEKKGTKLVGMLTDELANSVWPSTNLKYSTSGLEVLRVRASGVRTSTKNH